VSIADDLKALNPEAGNLRLWVNGQDLTPNIASVQLGIATEGLPDGVLARVQMGILVEQDFTEMTPALEQVIKQAQLNALRKA
jgi:hypothetical protein